MSGARRATWTAALAGLALAAAGCGKEEMKCPSGQTSCGGVCVDTASDPNNCLYCGFRCATGASCTSAVCQCPAGQVPCSGACVSLSADPNCGACGHACGQGTCSGTPPGCTCTPPATSCGPNASPECLDVNANDARNCGACGHGCGLGTCGSGVCACTAGTGIADCGPAASPQCVNTLTDANNCGACGHACAAGETCSAGLCCPAGETNCSGTCRDLLTDSANCGTCGNGCSSGNACSAGHCCATGLTWCDTACVDTATDEANCGTCGHPCSATQVCSDGSCQCQAPTPRACGTNCCAGTACCTGNTCQPVHSNGLGQSYYDCAALGTPGQGTSYTFTMAVEAGQAWNSTGTAGSIPCGGGVCYTVTAGGQCATWCYQSLYSGRVLLVGSIACQCPDAGYTTWN